MKLHQAVSNNEIEIVKNIIYGEEGDALINTALNNFLQTALHLATMQGNNEICDILCEAKANLEIRDLYGYTPLLVAALKGYTSIVEKLIEAGANVNITLESGENALLLATTEGHIDTVIALLKASASIRSN